MNISYSSNSDNVNWQHVSNIMASIDWGKRSSKTLEGAFKKSSFVRFAYDGDKLVGFARTVDDGVFYAWIVDLVVMPEYQGKGIGAYMLKALEADLAPFHTTMLTAAPGKSPFYEKQGWLKQTAAFIWPRNKGQKQAFTENR